MTRDTMPQVARYWNDIAQDFDAIYTGRKGVVARVLDRIFRRDMFERFEWVMRAGDVHGKTICDIGCGSGRFVTALAQRGAEKVTGVDVAPNMIRLARDLVRRDGVAERCELIVADVLDWKPNETFDLSIAIGFWDYIADPLPRLRIIRRLTRHRFLSAWPRLWTWRSAIRKARLSVLGCPVYFFRRPEVEEYLKSAGFRVDSVEVIGKLYCVQATPV